MGATETDGPYVSIATYHQCKTLSAFTKLTAEQLAEKFQYKKKDGTTGTVSFATSEINDMLDLQEFVRSFKHETDHDWMKDTAEDFIEFQETLVADPKKSPGSTTALPKSPSATSPSYKMKRQYSDYREINKRHFFPSWEKELKITALTILILHPQQRIDCFTWWHKCVPLDVTLC
jgi:hypothetical protein